MWIRDRINDADDLLWQGGTGKWCKGKRIANPNTHGTGCTLSSAIASNLAKGYPLDVYKRQAQHMAEEPNVKQWVFQRTAIDAEQVLGDPDLFSALPGGFVPGAVDRRLDHKAPVPVSYTHLDVYKRQGLQQ